MKLEQLERLRSGMPPASHGYPYQWFTSDPKSKQDKVKVKFKKKNTKNSNFDILQETLHATHPLKLLDKMYKYEMDPIRTVGVTEQIRDAERTDGQINVRSETNIPPPPPNNFV